MKFSQELTEKMKEWYFKVEGKIISDEEANDAWETICEYFETLARWDKEAKDKD